MRECSPVDGQLVWTASGPRGFAAAAAGDDGDVMMTSCPDDNISAWQTAYGEIEAIRETSGLRGCKATPKARSI